MAAVEGFRMRSHVRENKWQPQLSPNRVEKTQSFEPRYFKKLKLGARMDNLCFRFSHV